MMTQVANHPNLWLIYPTPILKKELPLSSDQHASLKQFLTEKVQTTQGKYLSNVGGWHSTTDLLEWPHPDIETLKKEISAGLQEILATTHTQPIENIRYRAQAWTVINHEGDMNLPHVHPGFQWSGVYYVATDYQTETPKEGSLVFHDPRPGAAILSTPQSNMSHDVFIQPKVGLFMIFPSWLLHSVTTFKKPGLRIVISFNLAVDEIFLKK